MKKTTVSMISGVKVALFVSGELNSRPVVAADP